MKRIINTLAFIALIMIGVACSSGPHWTVEGTVSGADGGTIILEGFNAAGGNWHALDTIEIDSNGHFESEQTPPEYPDVYRLNYGGKYIYFPIDSLETVTVTAQASSFDRGFLLEGSDDAKAMARAEAMLQDYIAANGTAALSECDTLKRSIMEVMLEDPASVTAYFLVHRNIDGRQLFRPDRKADVRIIGAVANAFAEKRPGDPRTKYLEEYYLAARRYNGSTSGTSMEADEIAILPVELPNSKGEKVKLTDVAAKNKVVLLNFTSYDADYAMPLNIELHKVYDRYHANGLEVYQVGVSGDEYSWRMAAANQPWVTVLNQLDANGQKALADYNVAELPALFVIANGELVDRVTDIDKLESILARYL